MQKGNEKESGENYIMRSLKIATDHQILFRWSIKKNEMGGACRERDQLQGAGVDGRISVI